MANDPNGVVELIELDGGVAMDLSDLMPVADRVGFVWASLSELAEVAETWQLGLVGQRLSRVDLEGGLAECFFELEPFTLMVRPRHLLVATANPGVTALFDCGARGGDPDSWANVLGRRLGCAWAIWNSSPAVAVGSGLPWGGNQLFFHGADGGAGPDVEGLSQSRAISATQDGRSWHWDVSGEPFGFEDEAAYVARRVRDRFPNELQDEYCARLGIFPRDLDFYCGPSVLLDLGTRPPDRDVEFAFQEVHDVPVPHRRPTHQVEQVRYASRVVTRRGVVSDCLAFGEEATAQWAMSISLSELGAVGSAAGWIQKNAPGAAEGRYMQIGKAVALAAVFRREGEPRLLRRGRRRQLTEAEEAGLPTGEANVKGERVVEGTGITKELVEFWEQQD